MSIASFLVDTITVSRHVGRDGYGDQTYAKKERITCRFESGTTKVRGNDGEERVSTSSIATLVEIGAHDRVWLPGSDVDDDRQAVVPVAVANARSRDGARLSLFMTYF